MRPERTPPVSQELVKGTVVPVVLALLEGGPRYGYEMVQTVNARTNGALAWSEGTLYPVLHRLEADGLVAAEWRLADARAGGRARRYYTLTGAGRRELKRRAAEWKTFTSAVGAFFRRMAARRIAPLAEPTFATAYSTTTKVRTPPTPTPTSIQGLYVQGYNDGESRYLGFRGNAAQSQVGVAGRCGIEHCHPLVARPVQIQRHRNAGEVPWWPLAVRLVAPPVAPMSLRLSAGAGAWHGQRGDAVLRLVLALFCHPTPPGANGGVR